MIKATSELKQRITVQATVPVHVINTGAGGDVEIYDQDENLIETVTAPGTYTVIVFSGIKDTGPPYTNSIVDNG